MTAKWQVSNSTYLAGRSHLDAADAIAIEMEAKWGVGRLRLLVTPELRAKFDNQRHKLNEAIASGDVGDLERESKRTVNAWMALNRAAEAAGAFCRPPGVWECHLSDGRVLAVVERLEDISYFSQLKRYVEVISLDEVAKLYEGFPEIVKAKQVFPGATVEAVKRRIDDPLEGWELANDPVAELFS